MQGEVLVTFEAGYGPSFGDEDLVVERRAVSFPRHECAFEMYGLHHRTGQSERIYPWHTIRTVELRADANEVEAREAHASVVDLPVAPG